MSKSNGGFLKEIKSFRKESVLIFDEKLGDRG
jgi:hypothetical protein